MAWDPTCAILSRFRAANLMNLLGLQAEVSQLQEEVEVLMFNDRHKSGPRSAFAVDWSSLYKEDIQQDGLQQKVLDLRLKLREYSKAAHLLQHRLPGSRLLTKCSTRRRIDLTIFRAQMRPCCIM